MPSVLDHTIASSDADLIASYSIQAPDHPEVERSQALHRIELANIWGIAPSSRVLELGCGQGNATTVLAHAVGPLGHVDAVDPGAMDYGAPFTLAQAQDNISKSAVGEWVSWHQATPEDYLEKTSDDGEKGKWDVAILAHCIWYFATPSVLGDVLRALKGRVGRVCIAEYALHASNKAAEPHVLAVLATGMLESFKQKSTANVRSPLSPRAIKEIATAAGWQVTGTERTVNPEEGLLDGKWEVSTVRSRGFLGEIQDNIQDQRAIMICETARDAVISAVEALNGANVRTMDVWAASFVETV